MVSVAAARYAKALADVVASSALDAAAVLAQLRSVEALIENSADLRNALASPAVAPSRKRAVLARLLEPVNVLRQVRNFTFIVSDHRRTPEFPSVVEAFERLMDDRLGFVRADVSSAHEMNEAQKAVLEAQLSRLSGRKARLQFTTDPSLLAGVLARVGSTVYDGSARGQLERLKVRLGSR
ncbi:MAG TPA: ATP synthase F1 subunit delta [Bryobacteraceae bacterium]|nr:ATP synthase F1 subunit delta [Bryobacteraceae bacterium]